MKKLDLKELQTREPHFESFIHHRSYGWRPLENETETHPWVVDHLIPKLEKELGIKCKLAGKNLLHIDGEIIISEKSVFEDNELINNLKKIYPVLKSDDIGYKIEKLKRITRGKKIIDDKYVYNGFWALSCDRIIERGRITGKKFGL